MSLLCIEEIQMELTFVPEICSSPGIIKIKLSIIFDILITRQIMSITPTVDFYPTIDKNSPGFLCASSGDIDGLINLHCTSRVSFIERSIYSDTLLDVSLYFIRFYLVQLGMYTHTVSQSEASSLVHVHRGPRTMAP